MQRDSTGGFTLLELLVVLALVGFLMSLVPSLISAAVPGVKLRVESRDLAASLRKSRNTAIASGVQVDVTINNDPPQYYIDQKEAHELPSAIAVVARDSMDLQYGYAPLQPEQITNDNFRVRFYPDGSSSGALITLRHEMKAYTVTVDWLLGGVSMTSGLPDDEI
jgi:general secretion pathway protein H